MRRLALPLSLLFVLLLLAPAATAASLRVAVVNVEYVVMNSKKGKPQAQTQEDLRTQTEGIG